jgi:hypothetical protein
MLGTDLGDRLRGRPSDVRTPARQQKGHLMPFCEALFRTRTGDPLLTMEVLHQRTPRTYSDKLGTRTVAARQSRDSPWRVGAVSGGGRGGLEARLSFLDPASLLAIRVVSGGGGIRTPEGPNGPLRFSRPPAEGLFAGSFAVVRQCVRQLRVWPMLRAQIPPSRRGQTALLRSSDHRRRANE